MTYATMMVHLELGCSNASVLHAARDLAERFDAHIIGITACQPIPGIYNDVSYISPELIKQDHAQLEIENRTAEMEFRDVFGARSGMLEWRSMLTLEPLAGHLSAEARSADIVITGITPEAVPNGSRRVNTGDLVMQLGRPVLVVPAEVTSLKLDHVVVAWNDTRESRRAALDALPLLRRADKVTVCAIAEQSVVAVDSAWLEEVVCWLGRHGVGASTSIHASIGDNATQLQTIATNLGADVVVAGAYGHSRLREWAFGGVTRGLLLKSQRCALVSH